MPARFHAIVRSIQLRQDAAFRRQAGLQTAAVQHIVAAVYGASGGKGAEAAVKKAAKIELVKDREPTVDAPSPVSTEAALRMFGPPMIPGEG